MYGTSPPQSKIAPPHLNKLLSVCLSKLIGVKTRNTWCCCEKTFVQEFNWFGKSAAQEMSTQGCLAPHRRFNWFLKKQKKILGADCKLKRILLDVSILLYRSFLNNCCRLLPSSVDHQHRVFRVLLVLPTIPVAVVEQMEPVKSWVFHKNPSEEFFFYFFSTTKSCS